MRTAHSTPGQDLTTAALGAWMIAAIFADGWAHVNLDSTRESFFTPSHALLYAGFLATAGWTSLPALRAVGGIARRRAALPVGYGLALIGAVWHQNLGIEVGLEALISPTHLLLMVGGLLVLVAPVRAAWDRPGTQPGLRALFPALLGTTLIAALIAFFVSYSWGVVGSGPILPIDPAALDEQAAGHHLAEGALAGGLLDRLATTLVLMGPLLLLLRRWRLPVGAVTLLFGVVSALVGVLYAGVTPWTPTLVAVGAGVLGDGLLLALRPGPEPDDRVRLLIFAAALPTILWALNFVAWASVGPITWPVELWSGTIALAAMTGFGLALLSSPPRMPVRQGQVRTTSL